MFLYFSSLKVMQSHITWINFTEWTQSMTVLLSKNLHLVINLSNKYLYCRYDDSTVNQVTDAQVLKPKPPRMPYLLMYRRHDTLPIPHRAAGKPEWVLPHRLTDTLPTAGFLNVPNIRPMFHMYHSITQSSLWNAQSMVPRGRTNGNVWNLENEFVYCRLHIYRRFCQCMPTEKFKYNLRWTFQNSASFVWTVFEENT